MTIKREDVDHRRVDSRGVTSGQRLAAIHPGEILRDEFLVPMKITVYQLAKALKVSRPRLNDIVLARRAITTDTALRLSRYFGTTAEFWINLQTRYNLDVAEETTRQTSNRKSNLAQRNQSTARRSLTTRGIQEPLVEAGRDGTASGLLKSRMSNIRRMAGSA